MTDDKRRDQDDSAEVEGQFLGALVGRPPATKMDGRAPTQHQPIEREDSMADDKDLDRDETQEVEGQSQQVGASLQPDELEVSESPGTGGEDSDEEKAML